MKIFNQQPNYKQSFAKGIRGAPGIAFNLTSDGNYDMLNKKLIKNNLGGYKYKMGIQCFPLTNNIDYTL